MALGCFWEEHSKAWWPCRPSLFSSLSPVVLGHLSVCHLRISLPTLLLGLCFGKLLRHSWVLRRQAWIPGSPLPHACHVEVEAENPSELWWSVWSWGQWIPSSLEGQGDSLCGAWRDLTGSVFTVLLSFKFMSAFSFSFNCFLGVSNSYWRTKNMQGAAS